MVLTPKQTCSNNKTKQDISPLLVRCICITSSLIVMAGGLVAMGTTCLVIVALDPNSAPCPHDLVTIVFGVAGGLFLVSLVLLLQLCRKRGQLRRQVRLGHLRGDESGDRMMVDNGECLKTKVVEANGVDMKVVVVDDAGKSSVPVTPDAAEEVMNFALTQKSADVSHWIEQQKSNDSGTESFPLEIEDGATRPRVDETCSSDGEMTCL